MAQPLGLFNADTPLTTAETASVFGEALTFKRLLALEEDPTPPAQPARGADRGLDRDRLPPDRDEPLRGRRPHRAARAGRALDRSGSRSSGSSRRRSSSPTSVDIDGYGTWWSYIPHFLLDAGLRLRVRVRVPLRARDLPQVRAGGRRRWSSRTSTCSAPAARARRRSSRAIVGLDLTDPSIWESGIDALAEELDEAEALATEIGLGRADRSGLALGRAFGRADRPASRQPDPEQRGLDLAQAIDVAAHARARVVVDERLGEAHDRVRERRRVDGRLVGAARDLLLDPRPDARSPCTAARPRSPRW